MGKQEDFVLRALEERDVRFVRLWFTDVLGFLKSVAVAPAELEGAFDEGIGFDGSAIEGFARVYEADMLAKPDPSTFQILPWRGEGPVDGADVLRHRDARRQPVVRRPAVRPQAHAGQGRRQGLHLLHAPRDRVLPVQGHPGRRRPTRSRSTAAATSTTPRSRMGSDFRREAITMLEAMGISVEFSHHEGGPGQQEIDLRYADALSTADNIMTFRTVIREVALSQGIWATFMPKPFTTHPGSGMHTHVSLFEGDRNAFFEAGAEYQLSRTGRQFIAGILRHASEITAVTNQWVNSYKRLLGGGEAPSYICWGHNNRSAMVRVPMYKPNKGQSDARRAAHPRRRLQPLPRLRGDPRRRHEGHRGGLRAAARGRGRRLVAHRARAHEPRASSRCPRACTTRSRSPRTPSCSPRPWASTSSTSSCATSARSGRSTAPRSPPSSGT